MHGQELYNPGNEELMAQQLQCLEKLYDFNATRPLEQQKRTALLKEMFAGNRGGAVILNRPCTQTGRGKHVRFGNFVYANFNLTLVDDTWITVGNHVMIGPNVSICTAGHPVNPDLRSKGIQFNAPVTIEDNVWIGASCTILPGVTIGENSVIGAGSVVTKDIPANVVAVGTPCRVLRPIGERDKEFYFRDHKIDGTFRQP